MNLIEKRLKRELVEGVLVRGAPMASGARVHAAEFTIDLPPNYPFAPPVLKLGADDASGRMLWQFSQCRSFIKAHRIPVECFCCRSLVCNWVPTFSIMDAVHDLVQYRQTMRLVRACMQATRKMPFDPYLVSAILAFVY